MAAALREQVRLLPRRPGIYRMYGDDGELLYVGKARRLRDRVMSYFSPRQLAPKVALMVAQVERLEFTLVNSDVEALILEYNLIKEHRPRYNIILRDDKSFPFIHLTSAHPYPRLQFYRGARDEPGRYFGPYPNSYAVRQTLGQVQKMFRIRNCRDSYFANRSRPCLQHQINRCSAPCVGLIGDEQYRKDVANAVKVLEGRSEELRKDLVERMENASEQLDYETAAQLRDQLVALKDIQAEQVVSSGSARDVDVCALLEDGGDLAICIMVIRGGRNLGTNTFFPRAGLDNGEEALGAFLLQYYDRVAAPPEVILNREPGAADALAAVLTQHAGHTVSIRTARRGLLQRWTALALQNARSQLELRRQKSGASSAALAALASALHLAESPARIECYDISHTQGEGTVGSCVLFGPTGPMKDQYRRYALSGRVAAGDDYAAMREVLVRRYRRVAAGEYPPADLLLIDGGAGQLRQAREALAECGFADLPVLGIAKGPERRAGHETYFLGSASGGIELQSAAVRQLLQRIRDEAHRFAIAGHRRRRARRFNESILETVPGLGPAKRRQILRHFGGLQGVLRAGEDDLRKVEGIGPVLAKNLYDHLHPGR
ncbi:MAG: excinuclease ABC subunit UvrC [Steroidobacteraceae bacterium]